jgi:hypothetical protein
MPDFEVFDKANLSLRREPLVTILKAKILSLNQAAYAALEYPDAVELMYDRTKRIIGLRAVVATARHACFVRPSTAHSASGQFMVSAMAFLKHYEIATATSRRWVAWLEDEILCVALDDEAITVTSNRAGSAASGRAVRTAAQG